MGYNLEQNSEDMWTPYKQLQSLIESYMISASNTLDPQYHEFIETLKNHRQNFLTLLKNPPKNCQSRQEILKGYTEGITSSGLGLQVLSKEMIDEALIISDMYNLNEFMALDLLYTAQLQMPHHPGLSRGLTAVLLYYDGRKALTGSLKTLVQARLGQNWVLDIPVALVKHITHFTNKLQEDGLLDRILNLLEDMDPTKELDLLQQNRALGGAKHHYMVMKLYNETRQDLADILYMWSAQSSLPSSIIFRLLAFLQKSCPESEVETGSPDKVTLAVIMAFLNCINLTYLHNREDGEEIVRKMPLIADKGIFEELLQKVSSSNISWESNGLRGFVQFAMSVSVSTIKSTPQLYSEQNITKEDEILLETALSNKAFHFAADILFKSEFLHYEEFYVRYFHCLISDFILLMPLKIKELRSRSDESVRLIQACQHDGIEPPLNLDNNFKYLMLMISELYKIDPLNLELSMDYWCQNTDPSSYSTNSTYSSRLPSRQVALFKFVRLAGEVLPAGLFVPYLKMIASLASSNKSARQAFNFLKPNGSTGSTTVSWDHFFNSLNRYYFNLRQELPPTIDTIYRQRAHPKGITPSEIEGLEAVLEVVQVVAKHDELSRISLCDHPSWKVLQSLIGLVSCAMPIPLKGKLLQTIAALGKSSEISATIWQSLEAVQILSTIPTTSSYQPRGVQTELEEIESRNEEYPLTRAMLELLDVLTDYPIPRLLGVGQRHPGFDPYLHFIINIVFLRFNTRSYKNPSEKWEICNSCLKIFYKLLKQYEPVVDDFLGPKIELQNGELTSVNAAPGYHLMTQLHSNTEMLKTILYILDEGCNHFDTFNSFPGHSFLEHSTLYCLQILECGLKMQYHYMTQLAAVASCNKILTGLSRLLLGINNRTGKPDHMINIAKYVLYNNWLPTHAFVAVGIIESVSDEPGADAELLSTFTSTSLLATNIRHGFVECLEKDYNEKDEEEDIDEKKLCVKYCKEKVLILLMKSINRPAPNLCHFLLGFDIAKDIRKTIIQQPGVLGYPRTCLHSVLALLEVSLDSGRQKITEICYQFLYILSSNNKTSEPVLRFLKNVTNQDFIQRHLSKLPFQGSNKAIELSCMSWLLKTTAIELRLGGGTLLNSLIQRLVGNVHHGRNQISGSQKLLMDLLHYIDFSLQVDSPKTWEYFDTAQVELVFAKCILPPYSFGGPELLDIKRLHKVMKQEILITQASATATQRKLIQQELHSILAYALKRNQTNYISYSTVKFVEGWCQTTEILFSIANSQELPLPQRQNLLLNLSHDLLQKMTSCEALKEVKTLVSGTVLILLVNLRISFTLQLDEELLPAMSTNATVMKIILNHIIQWLLDAEAPSQKVQTHLYGSFLYFLCIVSSINSKDAFRDRDALYVSQLDRSTYKSLQAPERSHNFITIQVINSFGDKLMEIICQSCSGAHDVCKVLAFSCLNKILELDCDNLWIIYLSSRGYLKHMIDSLLESDNHLRCMMQPDPQNLKPLYLYEAKLAMFIRMASTRLGAESLLENKILFCLSNMSVIDQYSDVYEYSSNSSSTFIPSICQRYQQIFLPMLFLCDALLTTLGTENQSCSVQICGFLQSHRDVVEMRLRNVSHNSSYSYLVEVATLTGVIARSVNSGMYRVLDEEMQKLNAEEHGVKDFSTVRELRAHLYRLQKLMLSLLPKFVPSVKTDMHQDHVPFIQIAANLMLFARNQMQHRPMDQKLRHVLFEPLLTDMSDHQNISNESSTKMHLGVVVEHLKGTSKLLLNESLSSGPKSIKEISCSDLKMYLTEEEIEQDLTQQRIIVDQRLGSFKKQNCQFMKYAWSIIEHCLYIIWSHLDYYAMQKVAQSRCHLSTVNLDETILDSKRLNELIPDLKAGLISIFTDSFVTKLLSLRAEQFPVDQNFIEALVRRIRRILQFIVIK